MKYCVVLLVMVLSASVFATTCKMKGCERQAGLLGYCSRHRDEAKKTKHTAKKGEKQPELRLKSFVGFDFLSKGAANEVKTCQLKQSFRSFDKAKLHYSSLGRLYRITLEDSVAGRSPKEIANELTAISAILERKYHFTFSEELKCDEGLRQTGGGYSIATRRYAPIKIARLKSISWYRKMEWKDFTLTLHGGYPLESGSTNIVTKLAVSFTMNRIEKMDREKSIQESSKKAMRDTNGIEVL